MMNQWAEGNGVQRKIINEQAHSDPYWGQCCSKTVHDLVNFSNTWWATLHLKDIFILGYPLKHSYDSRQMLSRSCIWMNVGRMHPPRLTMGPSVMKLECALHRMNMGDEHHWWCQRISFHNLTWQAEKNPWRRTLSLQRWAFYCKLWDACPNNLIVSKKVDDNIYLKGMFQLEASSWLINNLDGLAWCTQPIRG